MAAEDLVGAFGNARRRGGRSVPDDARLRPELERLWADARAAWPASAVTPSTFAAAIADRIDNDDDVLPRLGRLPAADLYLVLGCVAGENDALRGLGVVLNALRPAVASAGASAPLIDDVLATLRVRLLVGGTDGDPKLRQYRAEAKLSGWLRVAALREFRAQSRRGTRLAYEDLDPELDALMRADADPELDGLRQRYRDPFREAFAAALESLDPKQRTVLRHHLLDGLSIDRIAALYRVHRSTAARWLVGIRELLFSSTREHIMQNLGLDSAEFKSVLALIRSQLTYSITRFLDTE